MAPLVTLATKPMGIELRSVERFHPEARALLERLDEDVQTLSITLAGT